MKKLFLDDYRIPCDCINYMNRRIGSKCLIYNDKWDIVKNYTDFCWYIQKNGLPDLISFDHDLAEGHYHKNMQEGKINYFTDDFANDDNKTGYHCAMFLVDYCQQNNLKLPDFIVHSMNPVGTLNIEQYLNNAKKHLNE